MRVQGNAIWLKLKDEGHLTGGEERGREDSRSAQMRRHHRLSD